MGNTEALKALKGEVGSVEYATMGHTILCRRAFADYAQLAINAWHPKQNSLDAAISLMEAVLPGWRVGFITQTKIQWRVNISKSADERCNEKAEAPSRALLLCILSALISQEEKQQ